MLGRSCMLTIVSALLSVLMLCLTQLGLHLGMFGPSVRMCPLGSVFSSVLLRWFAKVMRRWDVSGDGKAWKVDLDVRDLSGHLDLTLQARGW